jgi:Zn-finger nucleic acid-binding protein
MLCPTDQTVLVMTDRKGVEIDYCPTCRGVWLDRGELDKIIDRSLESEIAAEAVGPAAAAPVPPAAPAATSYPPAPAPVADYGTPGYGERPPARGDDRRYDDRDRYRDERYRDERYRDDRDPRYDGRDGYDPRYRKRKKKESWLEDLFDF